MAPASVHAGSAGQAVDPGETMENVVLQYTPIPPSSSASLPPPRLGLRREGRRLAHTLDFTLHHAAMKCPRCGHKLKSVKRVYGSKPSELIPYCPRCKYKPK